MTVRCRQIRMPFQIFSKFFIENSSARSLSLDCIRDYIAILILKYSSEMINVDPTYFPQL